MQEQPAKSVEEVLVAAIAAGTPNNKANRLRLALPHVERARAAGISHAQILSHLNSLGFDLNMAYYRDILKRVRKAARKGVTPTNDPARPRTDHVTPPVPTPAQKAPGKFVWDVKEPLKF